MKKNIALIVAVILVISLMAGCGAKSDFEKAIDKYKGQTVTTQLEFFGTPVDVDVTIGSDGKTFEYAYNFMGNDVTVKGTIDGENYEITEDVTGMGGQAAQDIFDGLVAMNG